MTDFWDADGDFDYEAHHEAGQRNNAAEAAQRIGHPGMAEAFHYFGLQDRPDSAFTPELLAALDTWQIQLKRIETAPADQETKHLQRQTDETTGAILAMIDSAT
ncbi:hypothetical protein [Paenarthrobacter nitroguajacolicus]|uniref:hypothetical protein n=1 Tax=Paenarthrobacter nitroguajacolicus TaxID=211146 RepID=UPI00248BD521|nr:hypothetical protein [Paenarthrobacter nitroguajacolicus]MDI2037168.1 hypothetical protein [Paenarthrobacter nitroguajacolicus]